MVSPVPVSPSRLSAFFDSFMVWARKVRLARTLFMVLVIASALSAFFTYKAITGYNSAFGPDPYRVLGLVLIDLILFLTLMILLSRKLVGLWIKQRHTEGTRLQTRIVLMFCLVASVPTILVAVFSALFFNIGIQAWFDTRVSTAIEGSVAVAEAYLAEHKDVIRGDILAMAAVLNRDAYDLTSNQQLLAKVVSSQASMRSLTEAIVFQPNKILAQTSLSFSFAFERVPLEIMERAKEGDVVILTTDDDKVRALIKLSSYFDTYLLVGRFIDNKAIDHMERTQGAASEYKRLKNQISGLQIQFSVIFLVFALLLLLAAIGFGMVLASLIARPISEMVAATDRVKAGDFTARVAEGPKNDEIAILGRAFNRMTEQLSQQRDGLIDANRQIDARRQFSETVLSGVSAGIIALSTDKIISLINPSAEAILSITGTKFNGTPFLASLPEMEELLAQVEKHPESPAQGEISVVRGGKKLILLVRIAAEKRFQTVEGYVVTFDDITDFVSAQRKSAWADVARRIAHEIKNPLTPIHLAAERLKRKYAKDVPEQDTFVKYTDTIIRHVKDIGKIVEEFVNFARMPSPVFSEVNLCELVRNSVFTQQCIASGTHYSVDLPDEPVMIHCDASQITQTILNILKNAEESIEMRDAPQEDGAISLTIVCDESHAHLIIRDNGRGFPEHLMDRITEPYVTTRSKGTGLGLAIVKKIMEDHSGQLKIANNDEGGAYVCLSFAL
jgi:two-component system, NtrC family, nitrogen regulation sensor histidine kinase NtrY